MKYRAVIFDLFGTLVRNFSFQDYQEVLKNMASTLDLPSDDFIRLWYASASERNTGGLNSLHTSIEYIGQKTGINLEKTRIDKAIRIRLDYVKSMLTPREKAIEVLSLLKSGNFKVGLISDCSIDIPLVWDETPLASRFDSVIFSCSVGLKKPDRRIYELAAERLNIRSEECLFIGDGGSRELTGAANAGMHPVLIQPYGDTELPQADSEAKTWDGKKISSLPEVLDLVK